MAIQAIAPYVLPDVDQLPPNKVAWELDSTRCALLIHDMQRYFLEPFAEAQWAIVDKIATLRKHAEAAGVPVIFTAQPGHQERAERGLLYDFWGWGPGAGTDIPVELNPEDAVVVTKRRYSAFHGTELLELLAQQRRTQLIVCGVYAHIGCLATILDAFMHDIQPFAVADAMGDFSAEHHVAALGHIATRCGVVTTTADVLRGLERG